VPQDYCGALHIEGAFAGLSWADAKQIATAVRNCSSRAGM
jgi:hypothetical protein